MGFGVCLGAGREPLKELSRSGIFLGGLDSGNGVLRGEVGIDHGFLKFHGWEMRGLCLDWKRQEGNHESDESYESFDA